MNVLRPTAGVRLYPATLKYGEERTVSQTITVETDEGPHTFDTGDLLKFGVSEGTPRHTHLYVIHYTKVLLISFDELGKVTVDE